MNTFKGSIFALGLALLSATALEAAAAENSAPQMGSVTATEKSRSAQAFMDAAGMAASGGAPSVDLQSLKPSEARPSEFDPKANPRVYEISTQLRCLVCANAESNAQLAIDLRREVAEQVKAGKTDDEIIDFMVDRYGDYVLFKPPFKAKTWLLWLGPGVFFLLALWGMTRIVVTHTLEQAALRRYDGILVLKNGRIAESGTFDALMAQKGYFYALYTVSQ